MTRKLIEIAAELRALSDEELATVFHDRLVEGRQLPATVTSVTFLSYPRRSSQPLKALP